MNKSEKKIAQAAERFAKRWEGNNFPWPEATEQQRERIAQTAQAILDARALYPDSSLADLYDPVTMPQELLKAHRDNDRAVLAAYNLPTTLPEPDLVAHLFTLHTHLTPPPINQQQIGYRYE